MAILSAWLQEALWHSLITVLSSHIQEETDHLELSNTRKIRYTAPCQSQKVTQGGYY